MLPGIIPNAPAEHRASPVWLSVRKALADANSPAMTPEIARKWIYLLLQPTLRQTLPLLLVVIRAWILRILLYLRASQVHMRKLQQRLVLREVNGLRETNLSCFTGLW